MPEGRGLQHEVKAVSPSEKAQLFPTLWRAAVGPREVAAPTRRAAAARLALIMALDGGSTKRKTRSDGQELRGGPAAALLETSNHVGSGGRGLVAAA